MLLNSEILNLIQSKELIECFNKLSKETTCELELVYDGREDGNYTEIKVYAKNFSRETLVPMLSYSQFGFVSYSTKKEMLYVELNLDL
jgi:arsenate reductase-like glutaredoxin family protein